MDNYSLGGKDLFLSKKVFYIIDALYLNNLKESINELNIDKLDEDITKKVFPYTEAPFAKIYVDGKFRVNRIQKTDVNEILDFKKNCFSCDSGIILFLSEGALPLFLKAYDFYELVESEENSINITYWKSISKPFQNDVGLIVAPGIGSGYDFEGSGLYKIVDSQ